MKGKIVEKSTLEFLAKLRDNNSKEWFLANKILYEKARKNFEELVMSLIIELSKFDTSISGIEPKDCMFRIYRDVRFSKNKSPYKTNFGAVMSKNGNKMAPSGYYIHLEPDGSMAGGGVYRPDPKLLNRIREKINKSFDKFSKIIAKPIFKKYFGDVQGEKLINVPRGFSKDSPAAEYLKLKDYYAGSYFTDMEVLSTDFIAEVAKRFKAIKELNEFLDS